MTTSGTDAPSAIDGAVSIADVFDLTTSNKNLQRFVVDLALVDRHGDHTIRAAAMWAVSDVFPSRSWWR